jgi:hypothetical protein
MSTISFVRIEQESLYDLLLLICFKKEDYFISLFMIPLIMKH